MKISDLKNKLKNKVKTEQTKKFVEEHKSDIKKGAIIVGVSVLGGFVLSKYVQNLFNEKLFCELKLRSMAYNTAAVKVSGKENAAKIYQEAKAIDQYMHTEFCGLKYKDVSRILDNRGTELPPIK